jgi:aspartyl-tRNA(Asn)/glutamyl-tRNA(Gln) amidotransferase subunit A
MSMPCGYDDKGLPIGLQIIGAPFSEETIFRVGDAYEKLGAFTSRPLKI